MENDVYKEFLELVGYADEPWDEEMDEILPKWTRAAKRIGLTEKDIEYGTKVWIPRHFEVRLEGVRKTLGAIATESIDILTAKEYKEKGEKVVYGVIPATSEYYRALKLTDPKVNAYFPDAIIVVFMNPFFHKIAPILEDAEIHGIRYGCRHCALNKARYVLIKNGVLPMPDVSWIWGFACDQAPHSDEFIKEYWNSEYPTVFTRFPHDEAAHVEEYKVDERVKYLATVMRSGYERVCKKIGVKVDEEAINKALDEKFEYINKYGILQRLMAADPTPLDGILTTMLIFPALMAFNTGFEHAHQALDALIKDAKERVDKGEGVVPKGSPKLMVWSMPYCNPFVSKLFRENGVALAYSDGLLPSKSWFEPPRFTDPFEASAEAFLKKPTIVNWGNKADLSIEKIETFNIDGMIWGFSDFDRWLGSDHKLCSRYVEEKTGKPVFYIEGDVWEDRDYSEEALRTRIETICELVKARVAQRRKTNVRT